jgi:hypothetical protein
MLCPTEMHRIESKSINSDISLMCLDTQNLKLCVTELIHAQNISPKYENTSIDDLREVNKQPEITYFIPKNS